MIIYSQLCLDNGFESSSTNYLPSSTRGGRQKNSESKFYVLHEKQSNHGHWSEWRGCICCVLMQSCDCNITTYWAFTFLLEKDIEWIINSCTKRLSKSLRLHLSQQSPPVCKHDANATCSVHNISMGNHHQTNIKYENLDSWKYNKNYLLHYPNNYLPMPMSCLIRLSNLFILTRAYCGA